MMKRIILLAVARLIKYFLISHSVLPNTVSSAVMLKIAYGKNNTFALPCLNAHHLC